MLHHYLSCVTAHEILTLKKSCFCDILVQILKKIIVYVEVFLALIIALAIGIIS